MKNFILTYASDWVLSFVASAIPIIGVIGAVAVVMLIICIIIGFVIEIRSSL